MEMIKAEEQQLPHILQDIRDKKEMSDDWEKLPKKVDFREAATAFRSITLLSLHSKVSESFCEE